MRHQVDDNRVLVIVTTLSSTWSLVQLVAVSADDVMLSVVEPNTVTII